MRRARTPRRFPAAALALVLLALGLAWLARPALGPAPWRPAEDQAPGAGPVAGNAGAPGVPRFDHVMVVVMENKSYDEARRQPFTAALVARSASFPNARAVAHPSQPNYLALWSGSTMGVTSDACPAPGSPYTSENLGHACESHGLAWNAYCEGLPAPGSPACRAGLYVRKHAPWANWSNLDSTRARPLEDLARAIAANSLPALAFVIPDLHHDTHDRGFDARYGDDWLAAHVPGWLRALGPRGLFVLTWDEDDYSEANRILTVFAGPLVRPGATSPREVSHMSVLRTITDGLGLPPFGAAAVDSAVVGVWRQAPSRASAP